MLRVPCIRTGWITHYTRNKSISKGSRVSDAELPSALHLQDEIYPASGASPSSRDVSFRRWKAPTDYLYKIHGGSSPFSRGLLDPSPFCEKRGIQFYGLLFFFKKDARRLSLVERRDETTRMKRKEKVYLKKGKRITEMQRGEGGGKG